MKLIDCEKNQDCFIASLQTLDFAIKSIKDAGLEIKNILHCNDKGYHIYLVKHESFRIIDLWSASGFENMYYSINKKKKSNSDDKKFAFIPAKRGMP